MIRGRKEGKSFATWFIGFDNGKVLIFYYVLGMFAQIFVFARIWYITQVMYFRYLKTSQLFC